MSTPGGHDYLAELQMPAAAQAAADHAKAAGVLSGWNITLHHEDTTILRDLSGVSTGTIVAGMAQRLRNAGAVAAVGAGYSSEAKELAPALAAHDIVLMSQSATMVDLSDNLTYPFFGRSVTPDSFQVRSPP
eukprot:COSAG01_NODE_14270_length_1474_cov_1.731636_2_plen_132_part_00